MPATSELDGRLGLSGWPRITADSIDGLARRRARASWLWAIAAITLLAFVLRMLRLDYVNFHSDEAAFIRISYQGALLQSTAYDEPHPPLFLAMLQAWMGLAGISQSGIRVLPVLYGTALVPVLYQLGVLLGSRPLGLAGAFVAATNPAFIFYAKEVRNNGLMAFAGALSFALLLLSLRRPRLLPAYVVSAWAALYSHYYAIPVVGLELLVGLIWLMRERRRQWQQYAAAGAAAAMGLVPWLLHARSTIANYDVGRGSLSQIWRVVAETYVAFNLGFSIRPEQVFGLGLGMSVLVVLGLAGTFTLRRQLPLVLAAYALVPLVFGTLTLLRQTNFNPRYLFAGAPGYALIVGAGLLLLWRWHWLLGGLAAAFLLSLAGLTTYNTDFNPEFQPNGYREMASYLERHAAAGDAMVLDGVSQWPLYFYYGQLRQGLGQRVEFLPQDTPAATEQTIEQLLAAGGVWYVESDVDRYDPRHDVERLLAARGYQAADLHFAGQRLEYFGGAALGPLKPANVDFGAMRLAGQTAPDRAISAGQTLGVQLVWQATAQPVAPFKVSLRLETADGRLAAQNDSLPLGGYADFGAFRPGSTMNVRAGLIVPVGTLPGSYRLRALAYDAGSGRDLGPAIDLGSVTVDHAAPQRVDAAELPTVGLTLAGVRLAGASLPQASVSPGDRLPLTLLWTGGKTASAQRVDLALGAAHVDHPIGGAGYPTTAWRPGDVVREVAEIRIPPATAPGVYPVSVDGVIVGQVQVLAVERSFSPPAASRPVAAQFGEVAELVGLDVSRQGAALQVKLAWRALDETETSYTAFVHVLDKDGRVVSQVDRPPGTDRWVKGQVATITYDLPPASAEPVQLEIGLYDQPSGKRLPVGQGDSLLVPIEERR